MNQCNTFPQGAGHSGSALQHHPFSLSTCWKHRWDLMLWKWRVWLITSASKPTADQTHLQWPIPICYHSKVITCLQIWCPLPTCRYSCLTLCPWRVGQPVVPPPWQHLNSPKCLMARTQWPSVTPTAHNCHGFQLITAAMFRCYLSMKEVQDAYYPNNNSSDLVQWVPNNVKTVTCDSTPQGINMFITFNSNCTTIRDFSNGSQSS